MKPKVQFEAREIFLDTSEYASSVRLRDAVLLAPFGISLERAQSDDADAHHLALFTALGECVATLLLIPRGEATLQMRQVAVEGTRQRRGLGRRLLSFAEEWAQSRGFELLWANARETAVPFYEALGYRVLGERFEQVGLPHFRVEKALKND